MLADRTPLINGTAYSYADAVVNLFGVPLAGITSVKYMADGEVVNNYGAGRKPTSRGHGPIEFTASITIDRAEFNSLIQAAPNKNLLDIPEFDVVVTYVPDGSAPTTDIIKKCRFKNSGSGGQQGDTNIEIELNLVPADIEFDTLS